MHATATLLTSALAVGALALPQNSFITVTVREVTTVTATVTTTVGATVTVIRNPYETPAWTAPQFSQTPVVRPTNAPPLWTPPRFNTPSAAPISVRPSSSSTTRTSSATSAAPRPSSTLVGSAVAPSSAVVVRPSSTIVGPPAASSASTTAAPSAIANGHISGTSQAALSVGPEYQRAILYHHNHARANHNAAPLVWDDNVAATAAVAANTCRFEHLIPAGAGQGQNLFTTSGTAFNVTAGITESWYKGELPAMVPYFGQANLPDAVFHNVGHLTQVLWKGTTKVGCVSIDCGNRMIVGGAPSTLNKYTVCNYAPAGNVVGQYAVNVQAPLSTSPAALGSWTD